MKVFDVKIVPWIIILFAFLLRVPLLTGSFWLDEAAQAIESTRPFSQQLDIAKDFQPPLFHYFVHFVSYFGTSEAWLRSTSLLAGLVTVWATFAIGKALRNTQLGIISSLLVALNSYHIFFSQELRPYSFAAMWGVLSWLVLLKWMSHKGKTIVKHPLLWPTLYTVTTLAGLYSVYLYPFLLFSQIAYVFLYKKTYGKHFLMSLSAAIIGFLPWLPFFFEQLRVGSELRVNTQGWDQVVSFPQVKALPLTVGKFVYGLVDLDLNLYFAVSLSMIAMLSLIILKKAWFFAQKETRNSVAFYAISLIVPLLTAWLISFVVPVIQPKRVLFLIPFVYLAFGQLILLGLAHKDIVIQRASQILLGLLFLIQIYGTVQYYQQPTYQRENWRAAIQTIDQVYSPHNTIVVFGFEAPFAPWMWYKHQNFPTISTGTTTVYSVEEIQSQMEIALQYDTVIVFDYLRDLTDPNRTIEQWLAEYKYEQGTLLDYPNIGFIRVFSKQKHFAQTQ